VTQKIRLLELTPERQQHIENVTKRLVDILIAETANPLEGLLVVKFLNDALQKASGIVVDDIVRINMEDDGQNDA
jgi:hypothetical protein